MIEVAVPLDDSDVAQPLITSVARFYEIRPEQVCLTPSPSPVAYLLSTSLPELQRFVRFMACVGEV